MNQQRSETAVDEARSETVVDETHSSTAVDEARHEIVRVGTSLFGRGTFMPAPATSVPGWTTVT
ncbi:hypothetical protein [Streptomyces sp. CA-132043]|uniref:hypothetical protein n=1 Tax=Streptomyces sp. CA-132043 TaxID=3240048 RepID=UPI003D8CE8EF